MGLEGQSTLVQNFTFCCCCDVCLRLLHTLLELKVWLPSSSSVCCCLKFCPEQNEWVLVLFWMVELITDLSLPHPPPCSFCRISLVTGLCRVEAQLPECEPCRVCAHSSCKLQVSLAHCSALLLLILQTHAAEHWLGFPGLVQHPACCLPSGFTEDSLDA